MNLEKNNSGFTLIELIASITILGLITTISIANYKKGGNSTELIAVTQDIVSEIRKVQSYALSFKEFNGNFPDGGWGIRFQVGSPELIIFADSAPDHKYRQSDPDNEFYESKNISLANDVSISKVKIGATEYSNGYLVYEPPDPNIYIVGSDNANNVSISSSEEVAEITLLHKSDETKIIELNSFGLVDVK